MPVFKGLHSDNDTESLQIIYSLYINYNLVFAGYSVWHCRTYDMEEAYASAGKRQQFGVAFSRKESAAG